MRWFCPQYLEKFPKQKKYGKFIARVYTESIFGQQTLKFEKEVSNNIKAYKLARWNALLVDWGYYHPEIGVRWEIAKKN